MNPVIDEYGVKRWCDKEGNRHNIVGPAIIYKDGDECWFRNDLRHRLDGAALELKKENIRSWFWMGRYCTERKHYFISNTRFFTRRIKI